MRAPSSPKGLAAEVRRTWRERGALLLLSDFDGTLTPIVDSPRSARLAPAARRSLAALAARPDVAVAVISGRGLSDVQERVDIPGVIRAGCHGLTLEGPGLEFLHADALACRERLERIADDLGERLRPLAGVHVEPKELAVAVHYRKARPSDLAEVFYHVQQAREVAAPWLTIQAGKKVTEFLPSVDWHKGECALWLRDQLAQRLSHDPATVYLGDDETDERAFEALRGKALTVRVGSGHRGSAAARWVKDVAAVHEFLGVLVADVEAA